MMTHSLRLVAALTTLVPYLSAAVELPAVLGTNMVVQQEVPIALWGWADVGEVVTVTLGGSEVGRATGAGPDTPWRITVPAQKPGPVADIIVAGTNRLVLSNVLAGEVWLCSGQSNMVMTLIKSPISSYSGVLMGDQEVAAATDANLRLFREDSAGAKVPSARPKGAWVVTSPEEAGSFSGTAYFFGRHLRSELKRPVGLIVSAVGGTPAAAWTPAEVLQANSAYQQLKAEAQASKERLGPIAAEEDAASKAWKTAAEAAKKAKQPEPPKPTPKLTAAERADLNDTDNLLRQSYLYNGKIHPLAPFTVRGVVWYQGESDAQHPQIYAGLMTDLIGAWRRERGSDLPFLQIGIAGFSSKDAPVDTMLRSYSRIREEQQHVADTLPAVAVINAVDLGNPSNIHPANKQEVGRRAALWALQHVYQSAVVGEGPRLGSAVFATGSATVSVTGAIEGLKLTGPEGFALAGEDRSFVPATAELKGTTIVLSAPSVARPVAYRYAYTNCPTLTVVNGAGLPALPVRSDRWPVLSREK